MHAAMLLPVLPGALAGSRQVAATRNWLSGNGWMFFLVLAGLLALAFWTARALRPAYVPQRVRPPVRRRRR